ncbi:MAG: TonB-dependent receptor, partial [Bacteroidota bacterium]
SKKGIHRFKGAFYQYKVGIPEHESDTLTNSTEFQTQIQERAYIVPSQLQNNLFIFSDNIWYFSKSEFQVILGQTTNRLSEFEEDQIVPSMDLNLSNSLIQGKWIFKLSEKLSFVSGIQSMFQKNWNSVSASEFLIPNGKTKDIGVYSMVDLSLKNWFIQFGGRVDQRKLHSNDQNFQPSEFTKSYNSATYSLNALYKLHKNQFRFSASSGYRAPHFAELLSNGVHHGSLRYEIGSTNLQPEYANQFEASAKINAEHTSVLVNPFYQSYRHYIFLNPLDSAVDGLPVFRFEQLSKVQFMGIDISLHHHPHFAHGLHTETNFSFIQPIGNFETALIPQPRLTEIMQYEFASNKKLFLKSISLEATWCGSQYQVASFETPTSSYYTIDASVELIYSKKQNLSCSFGVRNITNQSYIDHLSRLKNIGIPMPGRSFLVSLKFELQKNKLR